MSVKIHGASIRFSVRPDDADAIRVYQSIVRKLGANNARTSPRASDGAEIGLEAALDTVAWRVVRDPKGNVTDLLPPSTFVPELDEVLEALGPVVERGSFIAIATDVEGTYRWVFDGARCHEAGTLEKDELIDILGKKAFSIFSKKPRTLSDDEDMKPVVPKAALSIRCSHPKFGAGTILAFEGDKADVSFDTGDRRKLVRTFLNDV